MSRTILVVDDNRVDRIVLSDFLRIDYSIMEADCGERDIALLNQKSREISAIVMDIVMPGMDGGDGVLKHIAA